jgi:hypothetical protein
VCSHEWCVSHCSHPTTSQHIDKRTSGLVRNLKPGTAYVFRILVTNPAGTVAGPSSKPIKTLPRMPKAPREEVASRSDTQVKLRWDAFGHEITKLALQYAILKGKDTFTDLKKNGGRQITLSNPQETGEYTVKNLKPETNYVFRLVASNSSGQSTGEMLGPVKTVSFSPDLMDKSGWMFLVSAGAGKMKRRGSIRNKGPPKCVNLPPCPLRSPPQNAQGMRVFFSSFSFDVALLHPDVALIYAPTFQILVHTRLKAVVLARRNQRGRGWLHPPWKGDQDRCQRRPGQCSAPLSQAVHIYPQGIHGRSKQDNGRRRARGS